MYVTRPLSHYIRHPESLSTPPEGPNSGYLVLQDEESETITCFGLCKSRYLIQLPFPQNKNLTLSYSSGSGKHQQVSHDDAVFIPVINQPLSSNLYYAIKPHGSHKGEAYACSREEDVSMTCCLSFTRDEHPRPLDPNDMYQQFKVAPCETCFGDDGQFTAQSIAPNGIPPHFLRRSRWRIYGKIPKKFEIGEALGINATLRAQLNIKNLEPIVVGKWYCPFMFIKDGTLADQMNRSTYYEMTLEQRWEQIFEGSSLVVNVEVDTEMVFVGGREATWDEKNVVNGVIWFTSIGEQENIGLSSLIIKRMKWEVTRFGWVKGENRRAKVDRTEEILGEGWSRFGSYVLVERFKLKRMDGSVALTYDFKHTQMVRTKWE